MASETRLGVSNRGLPPVPPLSWYSFCFTITDQFGRVICWPDLVPPTRAIAVALFGWLECFE